MLTELTRPFPPMILKLMGKPFMATSKHQHVALVERADVWLEISENVRSGGFLVRLLNYFKLYVLPSRSIFNRLLGKAKRALKRLTVFK